MQDRSTTKATNKFPGTRAILYCLIAVAWILYAIMLVAILFGGLSSYALSGWQLVAAITIFGLGGAIFIAVLSAIFVAVICLIDIRNFQAAQYTHPANRQPRSTENNVRRAEPTF